ncbi:ArnT family glycosyltransferase [Tundrisphaera lichenicola]|uniref:ArnT family glycosyltransferase n=1 Tax=Tundrisphaera lichenicola TaxID=2029860 RepID=UPI003EBCF0F6
MTPTPPAPGVSNRSALAWLALAVVWVVLTRVPLVMNAGTHLDSDLAVDGLTLLDAVNGHWRWHYPATPFIGIIPVGLSWLQALIWGANPITLVSGGVVAYGLVVLATFAMNRRAFGPSVASWGLVPLVFGSTGAIWLSGRITGGHLMAAAWHAGAFALLAETLKRGGWARSAGLGLCCGLGLYLDSMFLVSLSGVIVAASLGWWWSGASVRGFAFVLAFGLAMGLGVTPRLVGERVDPHDAYRGQLEPDTRAESILRNARILATDCLPRLVAGHRLPGFESEPDPASLPGGSRAVKDKGLPWFGLLVAVGSLSMFLGSMIALVFVNVTPSPPVGEGRGAGASDQERTNGLSKLQVRPRPPLPNPPPRVGREPDLQDSNSDPVARAIRWGLLASMAATLAGFLVNRTITNSDNYRYLVTWLVPWSTGFGLMMTRIARQKSTGRWLAGPMTLGLAVLMTLDTARWYSGFGWIDSKGLPVRKVVEDQALAWLEAHPEVTSIFGDYWDVYRLSFLTGGRVRGVPFPEYPERFPEIARSLPGGRPEFLIVRPGPVGPSYRARALSEGGREVERRGGLVIVQWPKGATP